MLPSRPLWWGDRWKSIGFESEKAREVLVSRAILVFNLDLLLFLGPGASVQPGWFLCPRWTRTWIARIGWMQSGAATR